MSKINRRGFLNVLNKLLAVFGISAVTVPVVAYFFPAKLEEIPSEPQLVGKTTDLPPGTGKKIAYGRYPALVINTNQGLRAYSAVCTHFACICDYDPETEQIACPCHDGFFDPLDGHVISGPPPAALQEFALRVDGDDIYLEGPA